MTPSPTPLYAQSTELQDKDNAVCRVCNIAQRLNNFRTQGKNNRPRRTCKSCQKLQRMRVLEGRVIDPSTSTKECAKCNLYKPFEEFSKCIDGPNGLYSYCKICKLSIQQYRTTIRAEKRREQLRIEYETMDTIFKPKPKICGNENCQNSGQLQPPENFDKGLIHSTGLRMYCRNCELERKRFQFSNSNTASLEDKREESKEYHRKWYEEHKDELNTLTKEWRKANPEEVRRLHIKRRFRQYGVDQDWYDQTLREQDGGCAICDRKDAGNIHNMFHIDHNHNCCSKSCHACDNCRRGLLCSACNTRLGHLENKQWKRQAMAYLNKYSKGNMIDLDQDSLFDYTSAPISLGPPAGLTTR